MRKIPLLLAAAGLAGACSDGSTTGDPGSAAGSGAAGASSGSAGFSGASAGDGASGGVAARAGAGGGIAIPVGGTTGAGNGGNGGNGEVCATETASASLEPVYLAFAFDVSGSMGKGDYPWHDVKLKWEPVVAATRAFLEDPASAGLQASLTVFPNDEEEDERCDAERYTEPDVSMRELPSSAFGEALDAIREEDWRGGTPTLAVVDGVLSYIEEQAEEQPGRYAFVLVTDGYPQGCDDDEDDIEEVAELVGAVAGEVPTFVLGIKNPELTDEDGEEAPDTVSDLQSIAVAGGTETAYLIDTGDPTQTSSAFGQAVDRIRGAAISCNIAIPEPPGTRTFEKDKVIVSYASGATTTELSYDPECGRESAWHYDDLDDPTAVVLCEDACAQIQSDPNATLQVAFTCETVIDVPR
jgi:hypothetical protein